MRVSATEQEVREWLKLSYSGPGFPLERDLYSEDLRPDQKRSVLDSIVRRERRRSGSHFKTIKRNEGLGILKREIRKQRANELWLKEVSGIEDWKKYNYLNCGRHGVEQQNKAGEKRLLVHPCNRRSDCFECVERSHEGKALEMRKRMEPAMRINGITERLFVVTLPDFIRDQIKVYEESDQETKKLDQNKTKKNEQAFKHEINQMFQGFYGCQMKTRTGGYEDGSIGLNIQTHWYSSDEPYREGLHWHVGAWPMKINGDTKQNVDRTVSEHNLKIPEKDLEDLKREWARRVKKLAQKLGFEGIERIPDKLDIQHKFIALDKGNKEKALAQFAFRMRYDMRPPAHDLEKAFKMLVCDENGNIERVILACKRWGWTYYLVWTFKEYYDELMKRLRLKGTDTSYGWLRRFKNNAPVLGVEVVEEKDSFEPIENLNKPVVFKRRYRSKWNQENRRFQIVKHLYVKGAKEPDRDEFWQEVDPWSVHGEQVWMGSRKKYLYKPLDRGG